jgi:hypothetical protein
MPPRTDLSGPKTSTNSLAMQRRILAPEPATDSKSTRPAIRNLGSGSSHKTVNLPFDEDLVRSFFLRVLSVELFSDDTVVGLPWVLDGCAPTSESMKVPITVNSAAASERALVRKPRWVARTGTTELVFLGFVEGALVHLSRRWS